LSARPLYWSFAWAYDMLVRPGGPSADWIAHELRAHGVRAGDEVIDAGCGTGDHALALARRGYRVIGVDRSAGLLRVAREKGRRTGADLRFVEADVLSWRPPRHCDAVLCRGVLNDITEEAEREAVFSSLAAMLRPGGLLVADVRDWDASVARAVRGGGFVRSVPVEGGKLIFRSETVPDHERRILRVRETLALERGGGQAEEHVYDFVMRPWSRAELEERLTAARFEAVKVVGGGEVGARADRLVVTARVRS
jgi:glycine/sarcosine N-methyltransferase